jgi:hypothetical protein
MATIRKEVAMKGLHKLGRAVGATVAAGAIIAGSLALGGVVFASGSGGINPTDGGAQAGSVARARPLAGAVHAEASWTLRDGSTRHTTADYGRIASVGNDSITIQRADGTSVSSTVGATTCIRNDGLPAALGDLKVGERVAVVQGNGTTLVIRARDGRLIVKTQRQGCGLLRGVVHGEITVSYQDGSTRQFSYDRGQITSITGSRISFTRADRQSVSLRYDSSTIVREDGHRVPVGSLKAGERAMFFSESSKAVLIRCVREAQAAAS